MGHRIGKSLHFLVGRSEFGGAFLDALLQLVATFLQGAVTFLNLCQHLIECTD